MTIWCIVPEIWSVTDIIFCHSGPLFAPPWCTINGNHMMYDSWDILPPNNPKNHNFEKMKKMPGDIIILYKCTKNHDHMLYCSLDMACNGCNCYFSLWAIFCSFTSLNSPKNQNSKKMKKTPGNIIILHMCNQNYDQMMYSSWDMLCDGQTDRQKKWHI